MPDLITSLLNRDLGFLRICASFWNMTIKTVDRDEVAQELVQFMLKPQSVDLMISSLPAEAREALQALLEVGARLPWSVFTRQWGEVRPVGPGRRDREQVYLHPVSTTEILTYRSLVANAFFDTPAGLQEFAYLPDDLLPILRGILQLQGQLSIQEKSVTLAGRPAASWECTHILPASDRLLDDSVTFLAALRQGFDPPPGSLPLHVVADFLRSAGVLEGNEPSPVEVKNFLEMPPTQALALLYGSWTKSVGFNELRQLPGLIFEGGWQNQSLPTRQHLLHLLETIPLDQWWSLTALVAHIKEKLPDFQRPAGDYDSWFIRKADDGKYLRGFISWDEVDGALVRYLVTGPLFWLGQVDLARAEQDGEVTAFRRRTKIATRQETARITISSNGIISIPPLVPRVVRYQVSRFCEWQPLKADAYRYRATVASLQRSNQQGLKTSQLLSLLAKHAGTELPPAFITSLKRWELKGTEARLQSQLLLRLSRPEVLDELRKSRAGRFLGDVIGPTTVVIKPGARDKVLAALADIGLLAQDESGK